jgi:hypothetical protein
LPEFDGTLLMGMRFTVGGVSDASGCAPATFEIATTLTTATNARLIDFITRIIFGIIFDTIFDIIFDIIFLLGSLGPNIHNRKD